VTIHAVIRDDPAAARHAWDTTARQHGIVGRIGADGGERGLSVGGPPGDVAALIDAYGLLGFAEVIVVFRAPFDLETIERVGEVRQALDSRSQRIPSVGA
jgi:alkanesulfonate monooxygenase SsuD/methylene tetrahydromethanopterin reductase-like flavin-dependent oxidoreductase (luciferase family)